MLFGRNLWRLGLIVLLMVGTASAFSAQLSKAQTSNLLTNPGFSDPYVPFEGDNTRLVADGWSAWTAAKPANAPGYVLLPQYRSAENQARILSAPASQELFQFYATFNGGIFQQVAVTPGTNLRFTVQANVWSTSLDDPSVSAQPSQYKLWAGIDPAGGTDATAAGIVWTLLENIYDQYEAVSVEATASADKVTVFVRAEFIDPVQHNHVYLDDAVLEAIEVLSPSQTAEATVSEVTVEPTAEATIAEEPTATPLPPTVTPVPPTATAIAVQPTLTFTPIGSPIPATATLTATAFATATITASATIIPSATVAATATEGIVPTREGTVIRIVTATPFGTTVAPTTASTQEILPATQPPSTATPKPQGTPIASGTIEPDLTERIWYTVQPEDTVGWIAAYYNSSINAIIIANGLNNAGFILVGQRIIIPITKQTAAMLTATPIPVSVTPGGTSKPPAPTNGGIGTYIVQPGDTLESIAQRYHVTVITLARLNGIINPQRIVIGQVLAVPGPGNNYPGGTVAPTIIPTTIGQPTQPPIPPGHPRTHTVQVGENLFRISLKYNVTMDALMRANNIWNPNLIYVGQVLVIP